MAYTTRTADYVIGKAWIEAKAKSVPPAAGTPKYNVLLSLVDTEQKNWEDEESIEWDTLYSNVTNGTISTSQTYTLDTSIRYISKREGDYIYLQDPTTLQVQPITLVRPNQLYEHRDDPFYAAQIGRTLKFSKAFDATSQFIGDNLIIPSYTFCSDIATGADLIQCDRPMYLAYMVAASYARNDLIKSGQYNNILDKATVLMNKMKQNNSGQSEELDMSWHPTGESWV